MKLAFEQKFAGRRVLLTGHTGFKGSWLATWLQLVGAEVYGIALPPETGLSLFADAEVEKFLTHRILDIRDEKFLREAVLDIDPHVVFHLAACAVVRSAYDEPLKTFATNTQGTANILDACSGTKSTRAIVCVTTDKVYKNREWPWPYRENDILGGNDPYSASKAAAELIAACYQQTMMARRNGAKIATARGGNVIGGGDWAADRIVPDLVRALVGRKPLAIRHPNSVRPWQHVLSLCHGYLVLAARLIDDPATYEGAWNFGPGRDGHVTVSSLVELFGKTWAIPEIVTPPGDGKAEAGLLALDGSKAKEIMGWCSPWTIETSVLRTAEWYKSYVRQPARARDLTMHQIESYRADLDAA